MAKEAREKGEHETCSFYLDSIDPIIDEIIASIEELSQHPYGCRAVQRMVEHCIEPQRTKILDSIIACQQNLLSHTYGNYVVQKVLTFGRVNDKDVIFREIMSNHNLITFSKQKQASNVVEAMLRLGDANQRHQIVHEMMNVSFGDEIFSPLSAQDAPSHRPSFSIQCLVVNKYNETESALISMAKDPFANFVVNTALKVLESGQLRDELYLLLLSKLHELVSYTSIQRRRRNFTLLNVLTMVEIIIHFCILYYHRRWFSSPSRLLHRSRPNKQVVE